ncbi:hypothetical protein [Nocardioides sp. B-3]|uniref:hypothetical protein n=1 Tax=Nocardioides sp. B-3 TaxID=2895565 RepID=UPI002153A602|nr:hypothetical protein [Nocardioides sp. B-3]UUZ61923.1 hypothetical protein LP418_01475 [Nocardioides sp. B-3]
MTSQGAIDTELGILKTGKEADVFLLERADPHDPDGGVIMAAKRYATPTTAPSTAPPATPRAAR